MESVEWLSVPEFAEQLGVKPSQVRDMLRDHAIVARRGGENNAWLIPASFITQDQGEPAVVNHLEGTLTLLSDSGLTDDEALTWLLEPNEALDTTPIEALRGGQRASVRRAAQLLA